MTEYGEFLERRWNKVEAADWNRLHRFVDHATAHAPEHSAFIYDLAEALSRNLEHYQEDVRLITQEASYQTAINGVRAWVPAGIESPHG